MYYLTYLSSPPRDIYPTTFDELADAYRAARELTRDFHCDIQVEHGSDVLATFHYIPQERPYVPMPGRHNISRLYR